MKSAKLNTLYICFLALAFAACGEKKHAGAGVDFARLDTDMARYAELAPASRDSLRQAHGPEIRAFAAVVELDDASDSSLEMWATSPAAEMFAPLTSQAFPSLTKIEQQIGAVLANAKKEGLEFPERSFAAVAWGRRQSIVLTDSVVLIALNHYLGPKSAAYEGWPEYMRAMKRREMIPYDVAEALVATAYPYKPGEDGETVLSRMMYEGALTEAKMRLVPDAKLEWALGMTPEQLREVQAHREEAWSRMVEGKMLYSTDAELRDLLLGRLPASTPISPDAPGRTAVFLGYEQARQNWHQILTGK